VKFINAEIMDINCPRFHVIDFQVSGLREADIRPDELLMEI
jgi:hypothetical protein